MEVSARYKQTEVGVIPEEWEVRSIGQVFRLINGCAFKPEDWKQTGTPIIRIQNLNDPSADYNCSQAPVPERNRVEPGDLLFAWSGTIGTSFGARVWAGPSGVLNQHIFKVLMDEQQITLSFSLLVFARVEEDIAKQAHGFKASFVHVKKSDLVRVSLPVPPLPEQRAIAAALSDVDALLGGLERLIAKKRDLKQAAMQQLLTGQTRLLGFHSEWDQVRLGDLFSFKNGLNKAKRFFGYGTPIVNYMDVFGSSGIYSKDLEGRVSVTKAELKNFDVQMGDVFFTRTSETTEEVGIASVVLDSPIDAVYSGFVLRARPLDSRLTDEFKAYCFSSALVRKQIVSKASYTTRALTNGRILSEVLLPLPPIPEQTAITAVLSDMCAELSALESRRDKTRDLKQAMMQELLTGKTRLVPAGGAHA